MARYARNRRLADASQQWALGSMRGAPGARAYYQALRDRGMSTTPRFASSSTGSSASSTARLKTRTRYDEHTAWSHHWWEHFLTRLALAAAGDDPGPDRLAGRAG